jgi:hypothetical protein
MGSGEEVGNVDSKHESESSEYETEDRNCEGIEVETVSRSGEQSETSKAE